MKQKFTSDLRHTLKFIWVYKLTITALMIVFSVLFTSTFIQQNLIYALNGSVTTNGVNTGFLIYQNDKLGIQIQYSPGWHVKEIGGQPTHNVTDVVSFSPPNTSGSGEVQVSIDSSSDNQSLASYLSDVIASGEEDYKDFKVISANTIKTLSGNPAYLLLSSYVDAGTNYETLETGTKIDNKVYFIIYDVEAANYTTYLPNVSKMIDSFKVSSSANK